MSEQPTQFTCFHCWEQFDASTLEGQRVARDHFGWAVHAEPACLIKRDERQLVFRIRAQEDQLARYRDEDGPKVLAAGGHGEGARRTMAPRVRPAGLVFFAEGTKPKITQEECHKHVCSWLCH